MAIFNNCVSLPEGINAGFSSKACVIEGDWLDPAFTSCLGTELAGFLRCISCWWNGGLNMAEP